MAKKNLTVTLYTSELLYDVMNKTYLTGRSRFIGTNNEEVAYMQANEDEENENQLLRSIGNAFSYLKTRLSEYIEETATTVTNNLLTKDKNLTITLVLPSNVNQATSDTVSSAAHQYIVNLAMADWFTITNKADAADYAAKAEANLQELREAINKRVRPVRTTI
jgi:hypothetical protein